MARGGILRTFAQRLKAHRLAAGLTQSELADRAGISAKSVWHYESQAIEPRERNRARLIDVLGAGLLPPDEPAARKRRRR